MPDLLEKIDESLAQWIKQQRMFFVGTAPLSKTGHINISPKGGDAFRVIGEHEVVYHDLTGSGAETAAHLRENGRIVILFAAFEGPPKIVRLHGQGEVIDPKHPDYFELEALFPKHVGTRSFIRIRVSRVSKSCGFSVPLYEYQGQRDTLDKWCDQKGPEGVKDYQMRNNRLSLDGLPAFDFE